MYVIAACVCRLTQLNTAKLMSLLHVSPLKLLIIKLHFCVTSLLTKI